MAQVVGALVAVGKVDIGYPVIAAQIGDKVIHRVAGIDRRIPLATAIEKVVAEAAG